MGAVYVTGFQSGISDGTGVAATAKHYIGEGQTQNGTNQGNVVTGDYGYSGTSEENFDRLIEDKKLLEPYRAAIEAGAYTVMASYNSVDGLKCHANAHLLNDLLKGTGEGQLGFQGFVVSDYNGVDQVAGTYDAHSA